MEEIKCPKCGWRPKPIENSWICSCKHIWNTFNTGGICPSCRKIHQNTQCLKCHQWSTHIEFYTSFNRLLASELDNLTNEETKK
jgi:hypothetical protein